MVHKPLKITKIHVYRQVPAKNSFSKWKDAANFVGDIETIDGSCKRIIRNKVEGMAGDLARNLRDEKSDKYSFIFAVNGEEKEIRRKSFIPDSVDLARLSEKDIEICMAILSIKLGIDRVEWIGI